MEGEPSGSRKTVVSTVEGDVFHGRAARTVVISNILASQLSDERAAYGAGFFPLRLKARMPAFAAMNR